MGAQHESHDFHPAAELPMQTLPPKVHQQLAHIGTCIQAYLEIAVAELMEQKDAQSSCRFAARTSPAYVSTPRATPDVAASAANQNVGSTPGPSGSPVCSPRTPTEVSAILRNS